MNDKTKGTLLTIISAIIFGTAPLFAKAIYANGSNSITFVVHRAVVCAIWSWAIQAFYVRESFKITWQEFKKVFICSVGFILTPLLLYSAYNYLSSGLSTTIHFVYPVLVLLGCVLFYREKVNLKKIICCVLCMVGIICFYTPDGSISITGILIALSSGVTYAFYVVYLDKSGLQSIPAFKLNFWINFLSGIEIVIVAICTKQLTFGLAPIAWGASLLYATLCCIGCIAFQVGTKHVGAQSASLLSAFEPATSVVLGILIFSEQLTLLSAMGIISILVSVILLSLGNSEEKLQSA